MATQPTIGKRTICCSRLISVALLLTMLLGVGQMTKAQQDLANQRPDLVFAHYEEAWQAAQAALGVVLAASEPAEDVIADWPLNTEKPRLMVSGGFLVLAAGLNHAAKTACQQNLSKAHTQARRNECLSPGFGGV